MKTSLNSLIDIFVGPPMKVPTEQSRLKSMRREVRCVVASCAGGNVLLQSGAYTTRDDLEALRAENLKYEYGRSK